MDASGLTDEQLIEHLAASPFAPLLRDDLEDWALRQRRGYALKRLEERFRAYSASPSLVSNRRVLRALIECCRLFDLSMRHARLFAELGRVDDNAPALVQLVIKLRAKTRPIREKRNQDAKRKRRSLTQQQEMMFFLRVGAFRESIGCSLPEAFEAVAHNNDEALWAESTQLDRRSVATIKAAWQKWAKRYRDHGKMTVFYGPDRDKRSFVLRKPGRPRK